MNRARKLERSGRCRTSAPCGWTKSACGGQIETAAERTDCDSIERMSAEVKQLLHEALKLSTDDRAELAAELLASLDESGDSGDVEGAWAAEIERRARRVLAG